MEKFRLEREIIAMRVARELQDGDVVNLGIGIQKEMVRLWFRAFLT